MSDVSGPLPLGSLAKPTKRGPKPKKPIKQRGKRTLEYDEWRDTVAIPYLDEVFGHFCTWCSSRENLTVDHIKRRGSHPELKMELSNVQWLCIPHHIEKDGGML